MRSLVLSLLLSAAVSAVAQESPQVPIDGRCDGDRLVELRIVVPRAGVIVVRIPRDVCEPEEKAPAPEPLQKPARDA